MDFSGAKKKLLIPKEPAAFKFYVLQNKPFNGLPVYTFQSDQKLITASIIRPLNSPSSKMLPALKPS